MLLLQSCLTPTHQAPLSLEFSRQEYWRRLPFPTPGDLPDSGIESKSPELQAVFFLFEPPTELAEKQHIDRKHKTPCFIVRVSTYKHPLSSCYRFLKAHLESHNHPVVSWSFQFNLTPTLGAAGPWAAPPSPPWPHSAPAPLVAASKPQGSALESDPQ